MMYVATAASTLKIHSIPERQILLEYQPRTNLPIRSLSWSKEGTYLGITSLFGPVEIISNTNDQLQLVDTIENDYPTCAAFQNTFNEKIAFGTKAGKVAIYNIETSSTKWVADVQSLVSHIGFTGNDTHILVGSIASGDIFLLNQTINSVSSKFRMPQTDTFSVARPSFTKRNLIIAGDNEGNLVVWDCVSKKVLFYIKAHIAAAITGVAFSPINPDLVVSTGLDRHFCFCDLLQDKCITSISTNCDCTAVDFAPNGVYVTVGMANGNICDYDLRNVHKVFSTTKAHSNAVNSLAFKNNFDSSFKIPQRNMDFVKNFAQAFPDLSVPLPPFEDSPLADEKDFYNVAVRLKKQTAKFMEKYRKVRKGISQIPVLSLSTKLRLGINSGDIKYLEKKISGSLQKENKQSTIRMEFKKTVKQFVHFDREVETIREEVNIKKLIHKEKVSSSLGSNFRCTPNTNTCTINRSRDSAIPRLVSGTVPKSVSPKTKNRPSSAIISRPMSRLAARAAAGLTVTRPATVMSRLEPKIDVDRYQSTNKKCK